MSKPMTALGGVADAAGFATVKEIGPVGMITLRGNLTDDGMAAAVAQVVELKIPEQRKVTSLGSEHLAWMSQDELLMVCAYDDVGTRLGTLQTALSDTHALAVNVSDARAVFQVMGPNVREVLAKLMPVDLRLDQFQPGDFRRTRLAQVPAAFWMPDPETAQIICFRSVAQYVFDVLNVASQEGAEVGFL